MARPGRSAAFRSRVGHPARTAVLALVIASVLPACAGGSTAVEPLPPPPSTAALAPTTAPVDYSGVALPTAGGRTTTTAVALQVGKATLKGRVVGPDGAAIESATVRIERLVGTAVATTDVPTAADGSWALLNAIGGRYRLRAWRPPDLAMVTPASVFLGASETGTVDLTLERHFGTTPAPAIAPARPVAGQPANLVVQVTTRSVDAGGIVQGVPIVGVAVELGSTGGWTVVAGNPTVTDAGGRARWEVVCAAPGVQPLRLLVNHAEPFQLALPACVEPPAPPPSTTPSSTTRPGATTTTTRAGGATTTTRPAAPTTTTRPRAP